MTKYYINYHTGAGDRIIEAKDIYEAMDAADKGAAYTQCDITIEDDQGNMLATRRWYGVKYNQDEDYTDDGTSVIEFGDYGYYDHWYLA